MNRSLWFLAGAGAGVYAVARVRRAAEVFTPEGWADRLAGLSLGAHLFGEEVRAGMAERETALRRLAGSRTPTPPQAPPDPLGEQHPRALTTTATEHEHEEED